MEKKLTIIRFMNTVNQQTITNLINIFESEFRLGVKKFKLLISSPGGFVDEGISIFNYLKGLPIDIETVNFGAVDSISAVIFCAGKIRTSVPNARFLIHDVGRFAQNINFQEALMNEWLKSIKIDRNNIAKIIAETCGKKTKEIENLMKKSEVLNPIQAQKIGLVNEIKKELIEDNKSKIFSV